MAERPSRSPIHLAFRMLGAAAEPLAPLVLRRRRARGKEHEARWSERLGMASLPRPQGALIWVHAASVGEASAVLPLVRLLRERLGVAILLTTGTVTSAALVQGRLPAGVCHQFAALDLPGAVDRFLGHWRPDLAILVESEIWPGWILALADRQVPVALVNGRFSERSFRRWSLTGALGKAIFSRLSLVAAQSPADAERFADAGAPMVATVGNIKFDSPPPPADTAALAALQTAVAGRPVFAAASTHPGEEDAVVRAHSVLVRHFPGLLTLLAPRHPDRAEEVAAAASAGGVAVARRTQNGAPAAGTGVFLFDTIGELGLVYRLASLAFVGGSLVPHGGQNPLEPAKLGTVVLHGPHVHNFREIYQLLDENEAAVRVDNSGALAEAVRGLLLEPVRLRERADRASAVLARSEGALQRTMSALQPLLREIKA